MSNDFKWKSFVQIAVVFLLLASALAVYVYYSPFVESAAAYDVSLVADDADKEVEAGKSIKYYLTITNEGGNQDRYTVTKNISAEPSGWTVTLSATSTGNIGSGNNGLVTVTVKAPVSANTSSECLAVITVTSVNDPVNSSAYSTLTTTIKREYGASITSPGLKYIEAGKSKSYGFTVKNEGNDEDGFNVEVVTVPDGWTANEDFSTSDIEPEATLSGNLLVTSPQSAKAGTYQIKIKATSLNDNSSFVTKSISILVNQTYQVNIQSEGLKTVDITENRIVPYNVVITNLGNGQDWFGLEAYIPQTYQDKGWGGTLSTTLTSYIDPNKSLNVTFYAKAPSTSDNPPVDSEGKFWINATSQGDPSVTQSISVSAVVEEYYDLDLLNKGSSQKTCAPNATVDFTFNLTNLGNSEERFTLDLEYPDGFEQSTVNPGSVRLKAGESYDVTVTVIPKDNVVLAQAYSFYLTASVDDGPNATEDFGVTINTKYDVFLGDTSGSTISNGQPGNSYTFNAMVQNIGNDLDSYTLSVEGDTPAIDLAWNPSLTAYSTPPKIDVEGKFYFNVTVSAPSNASTGNYRFYVTATSKNDASVSSQITMTVQVPTLYNVDLSANKESVNGEYSNSTGTPRYSYFDLDVYNQGSSEDDSITLSVKKAPAEFAGLYSTYFTDNQQKKITIPQGSSKEGELRVQMPKVGSGVVSDTYFFIVQVKSDNGTIGISNDDITAEINLSLTLQPLHSVRVLTDQNSSQVRIGFNRTYNVIIQNRGTTDDYFDISLDYPNYGTSVEFKISKITTSVLEPLEKDELELTIDIKNNANPDWGSVWCQVTAEHNLDTTIKDSEYFTATFQDDYSGRLSTEDNYEQAYPGEAAWYNITLKNTGTRVVDTFEIEIEDEMEFENIEISPSLMTISSLATKKISINISVPSIDDKIIETGVYDIVFMAISEGETSSDEDDIIVHNITLKIKVMPVYKLQYLIPEGSTSVEPGDTTGNFELNVTNQGNEPVTVLLKKDSQTQASYQKWATISPATLSDLQPNAATSSNVKFKVPSGSMAEKVVFYFTAEVSGHSDEAKETATFELTVEEEYDISMKVSDGVTLKDAEPNEIVEYTVKLTNDGNTMDSFDITLSSNKATWAKFGIIDEESSSQTKPKLSDKTIVDLEIDGDWRIWLEISVPEDAPAGEQNFRITATSKGDDAVIEPIDLKVDVAPRRDVELISSQTTKEVVPDPDKSYTEIEYEFQVVNKGEDTDSFFIEVLEDSLNQKPSTMSLAEWNNITKSDHPEDVILSKKKTGSIIKGGQETITVTIRVQESYYEPGSFRTVIWAYSEGNDKIDEDDRYSNTLTLKTDVEQTYGLELGALKEISKTEEDPNDPSKLIAEFTLKIENTGTGDDVFILELLEGNDLTNKFDVDYPTGELGIDKDSSKEVQIVVTIDRDVVEDKYDFEFRAISGGEDGNPVADLDYETPPFELTIDVEQTYGVDVEVDREEKDGEVGDPVTFNLKITNEGNADDEFRLEIREPNYEGWVTADKTTFTLGPKGSNTDMIEIKVTVRIPNDNYEADAGFFRFNVTVRRDSNIIAEREKAMETIQLSVDIGEVYEFDVESDDDIKDGDPGDILTYSFEILNRGNIRDTYNIEVKGDQRSWVDIDKTEVILDPDQKGKVTITVSIPSLEEVDDVRDIESGSYDITVEVSSRGDRDLRPETKIFTVDVEQVYGVYIPTLDQAGSAASPKDWDINDDNTLEITFFLENQGNDEDTFRIRPPSIEPVGWNVKLSSTNPTVPIGEQEEMTITITFDQVDGIDRGLQSLTFRVEPARGTLDGRNARESFTIYVDLKVPNLEVDDDSFRDLPKGDDLRIGEVNTFDIYISNTGDASAKDFEVVLLDNDQEVYRVIESVNERSNKSVSMEWKPTSGDHELTIRINSDFVVKEYDEDDNEYTVSRELPPFNYNDILFWLFLILMIIFLLAAVIAAFVAMNKNKEAKELAERIKKSDIGLGKGGARKVIKETGGAPAPGKGPAGLPPTSAAPKGTPSLPADKSKEGGKSPKKETVKVQCQNCYTEQLVSIDKRPAKVPCKECGVTMLIPEKKGS